MNKFLVMAVFAVLVLSFAFSAVAHQVPQGKPRDRIWCVIHNDDIVEIAPGVCIVEKCCRTTKYVPKEPVQWEGYECEWIPWECPD